MDYLHDDKCGFIENIFMKKPEVLDNFFHQLEPRSHKLMRRLKHFKFRKNIIKDKFVCSNGLKLRTDFNTLLNSLEKDDFLVLFYSLGVKLLYILKFSIKCPEPLERIIGDNMRGDKQFPE